MFTHPKGNPLRGLSIHLALLVMCVAGQSHATADPEEPDCRTLVVAYADAMIERGRDVYGERHSPLFAAALDRGTMEIGTFPDIPGVRNDDRSPSGANPQTDKDLYAILYRLTELTGDRRYATEADRALEYFFNNCQSPQTGLMTWGEHAFWDFRKEGLGGTRDIHEINGEWPYWDVSYRLAPEASWQFALGLWRHQVADHETGAFSRHAKWSEHGPAPNADFPRYAGQMIACWADALARPENRSRPERGELERAIEVIVGRMEANMKLEPTGYLVAARDGDEHQELVWLRSNLELARCLWNVAPAMNQPLAGRMRKLALKQDQDFFATPHTIAEGGGFVSTLDSRTGKSRSRARNKPYTTPWATGYGYGTHASAANLCHQRFAQLRESHPDLAKKYRAMILAAADTYLDSEPDRGDLLKPDAFAEVIDLLLNAAELTGDVKYRNRAVHFARFGIELFLDDGLPLPKASNQHVHYETITGGPEFMRALLRLSDGVR